MAAMSPHTLVEAATEMTPAAGPEFVVPDLLVPGSPDA
jgi:hypothetical protein